MTSVPIGAGRAGSGASLRPALLVCAWLVLITALRVVAAADAVTPPPAPAVASDIIELPKFEVTDSRLLPPPESWQYAEIPGFEILSRTSARETKRFVRDFLLLQEVIGAILPVLNRNTTPVPTLLLLCGRGKGFDEFLPADRSDQRYGTNSLFFQNRERAAIVIDFALAELQLEDFTTIESDPYRAFYLEYFRFLLHRQLGDNVQPWFEEGLVQIFAATDFDKKTITFAQVGDGFGGEKSGDFNRLLLQRALMPLPEMFAHGRAQGRETFWSAQCYAFVHYCLYGMGHKYQQPVVKFLMRLEHEPVSEALFKECFRTSYSNMAAELRGYLDFTAHTAIQFRAKKGEALPEPPPVALRDAPDAVVGRIKGEVLRMAGRGDEAHNALIAPYIRGERDPRLLASLGLDEKIAGHDERARKFLEAATAEKVDRARAYLELGRLRYDAAVAKPEGPGGKLDEAQVTFVLAPLLQARQFPPPLAEVYALIAQAWAHAVTPPKREQFDIVLEGVRRFPRDPDLLLQAVLLAADPYPAEARAIAQLGVRVAATEADRDRFQVLAAALERDEKPPAGTPPPAAPQPPPDPFAK
jgi:hypothetical protein